MCYCGKKNTVNCLKCGTGYCSRKCQINFLSKHRPRCKGKEYFTKYIAKKIAQVTGQKYNVLDARNRNCLDESKEIIKIKNTKLSVTLEEDEIAVAIIFADYSQYFVYKCNEVKISNIYFDMHNICLYQKG